MIFAKAWFLGVASVALVMWVAVQEQRASIECMNAGLKWRASQFPELVGTCLPGRSSARIYLPPLQIEPAPSFVDPEIVPVPVPQL